MNETQYYMLVIGGVLFVLLNVAAGLIWLERRMLALWQDRYGPNRAGPFGLLIVLADTLKLFFKEDWIPPFADKKVFVLAPAIVVITVLMSFVIIPFAPGIMVVDLNIGILFFLAMSSMGAYSIIMGGWASNNKYALLGAMRGAAQMISYEVFMGLSLMGVVFAHRFFKPSRYRHSPTAHVVCRATVPGIYYFPDCRNSRNTSFAF